MGPVTNLLNFHVAAVESILHQLPVPVQRKAVELVWRLPLSSLTPDTLSQLAAYVNRLKCDDSTLRYLLQVVTHRYGG